MKSLLILISLFIGSVSNAQDQVSSWEATVSTDSLLLGNHLKITFTLKNTAGGKFVAPNFNGFNIIGGPNQNTSMSFINGKMSQESSYSYILEPVEEGTYFVEPASIEINGEVVETSPIEVIVFPNPDGIRQNIEEAPLHWDQLPWTPPEKKIQGKKKKRIYKI